MSRVAVFVDAGYLFAQGSTAMFGERHPRANLTFNVEAVFRALTDAIQALHIQLPLLRVYWYDGARPTTVMPPDHVEIARARYMKLRLGMINGMGQQKGVDSLIVTDLIELARNHAISEALLLSGDEDLRIGVTIAQTFGVCVHLIGIAPSIGSQSTLLMQEADTTTEWDGDIVRQFLTTRSPVSATPAHTGTAGPGAMVPQPGDASVMAEPRGIMNAAIEDFVTSLSPADHIEIAGHWAGGGIGLPPRIDSPLLKRCGRAVGRHLEPTETRYMRDRFAGLVRDASDGRDADSVV